MTTLYLSGKGLSNVVRSSGYVRRDKEMPQADMVAKRPRPLSSFPSSSPSLQAHASLSLEISVLMTIEIVTIVRAQLLMLHQR